MMGWNIKKPEEAKGIKVNVKLVVPKELEEGRYANYAAVNHSAHKFHIHFAQITIKQEKELKSCSKFDQVS